MIEQCIQRIIELEEVIGALKAQLHDQEAYIIGLEEGVKLEREEQMCDSCSPYYS